jgi:hypothetical protein
MNTTTSPGQNNSMTSGEEGDIDAVANVERKS